MSIQLIIPGRVKGKGRPRFGRGHAYTPKDTVDYEKKIKAVARSAFAKPLAGKVKLHVFVSQVKPKKPTNDYPYKPDLDNVVKIVMDSLNRIAYNDDTQVVEIEARKFYDEVDQLLVRVREL